MHNVGFDWEDRIEVWKKVKEEIQEFETEIASMDKECAEMELGDILFSLIKFLNKFSLFLIP